MEQQISVEPRTADGKGGARKLRRSGKIPGILYGHKEKALSFALNPRDLEKAIGSSGVGRNTVLKLSGLERDVLALVKDTQVDPVRRNPIHIDLQEVRVDEDVAVEVPVEFVGKPAGIVKGGQLQAVRFSLRVYAKPLSIPRVITIDVSHLDINDVIHVRDVQLGEGLRAALPGHLTVVVLAAPEKAEEVAATDAAPAAAAAGAKAPAAAAAKAPAAAAGKAPAAAAKAPAAKAPAKK